ncbi:Protein of unknown function [Cotesia congregata]|uniref:Uncharacterized protein n=1 Tax=Cotesia congregata TaxID=51543 RepID=A0A8J2HGS2_COTCN|nr:Protein of unknown function [Cotesia congregata]
MRKQLREQTQGARYKYMKSVEKSDENKHEKLSESEQTKTAEEFLQITNPELDNDTSNINNSSDHPNPSNSRESSSSENSTFDDDTSNINNSSDHLDPLNSSESSSSENSTFDDSSNEITPNNSSNNADSSISAESEDSRILDNIGDNNPNISNNDGAENINNADRLLIPLYRGSVMNVEQSNLMILSLLLKHNMTQSCISDVMEVVKFHCPSEDLQKNNLHTLNKYVSKAEPLKHYYCVNCLNNLMTEDEKCSCGHEEVAYFLQLSIFDQLQELFCRPGFFEQLQHRFHRQKTSNTSVEDIYDGTLYQKYWRNGFFASPCNISLTWYIDGVSPFKSSKYSLTPFYIRINELPYHKRILKENTILAGLLYEGKQLYIHDLNALRTVKAVLLTGTADLPAKAAVLNMMLFNGEYGCVDCENPGETLKLNTGGHTHIYKYQPNAPLRSLTSVLHYADESVALKKVINGVKGPCALSKVMPNFIVGNAIDLMHCIYEGNAKKLMHLWFDVEYSSSPFSFRQVFDVIKDKFKNIQVPRFVHRFNTIDNFATWKASEFKNWFFYYSVPILSDIMTLDDKVKSLGPLWSHSCFSLENLNGLMIKICMVQPMQIHKLLIHIGKIYCYILEYKDYLMVQCVILLKGKKTKIFDKFSTVGTYSKFDLDKDNVVTRSLNNGNIRGVYGLEYFRLLLNGTFFISKNYKETLKNNSSYVAFKYLNEKRFGLLHSFIKIIDKICDCQKSSNKKFIAELVNHYENE